MPDACQFEEQDPIALAQVGSQRDAAGCRADSGAARSARPTADWRCESDGSPLRSVRRVDHELTCQRGIDQRVGDHFLQPAAARSCERGTRRQSRRRRRRAGPARRPSGMVAGTRSKPATRPTSSARSAGPSTSKRRQPGTVTRIPSSRSIERPKAQPLECLAPCRRVVPPCRAARQSAAGRTSILRSGSCPGTRRPCPARPRRRPARA